MVGQLLGTSYQMVAKDVKGLKSAFSSHIVKQLKKGEFYEPDLTGLKSKTITLKVRPHYRGEERLYPLKETITLQIPAVYGDSGQGFYECYLPLLNRSFVFYSQKDLNKLVEYFSRDVLQDMSPSEVHQLLLLELPTLEMVKVKSPKLKRQGNTDIGFAKFKNLIGIAEQLPYTRKESGSGAPDVVWERGVEVEKVIDILMREEGNVLLVGKSGVGKSAILREAIRRMYTRGKSKEAAERHSYWRTSPSRMIAKAKYLGEWQQICEDTVEELKEARGYLWIENFVTLAGVGGEGPEDSLAAFLTPFIRQGELQIMSEVSPQQLEAMRRVLPGFVEHFRILKISEMDAEMTLKIFAYFNEYFERNNGIVFTQKALEMSYVLLDRFIRYDSFPGKAIQFLNVCTSKAFLNEQKQITVEDVVENCSLQTGIPETLLRDDIVLNSEELRRYFLSKIKGQDHIIDQVCSVIKVFKAGLNDPNKPIATLLFAGPTGVGKTATAKALSEYFFGIGQSYQALIRLDMSEFQHAGQIYRLIGSDGKLVQHVRQKPFSVVLLDEIEKANPLIFDALLTVLDEGILIDSMGRLTDFRNTIIIMTSNLGSKSRGSLGYQQHQGQNYDGAIKKFFRPEFYNRIDMCLIFNSLEQDAIRTIALRELNLIIERDGIRQRNIQFRFTDALVNFIAEQGFDIRYGARPLQREIERLIVAPLAKILLEQMDLKNKELVVDYAGGVVFK